MAKDLNGLEVVSDYFLDDTFEVTKESARTLVAELQSHKFIIEDQNNELKKLGLIKREHDRWLHGDITVVQFAYNVEEILNDWKINDNFENLGG
ncbi:Uncharacterised protein [Staphylococcus petrasii]|uniref:Phage protein n=1 Tax=Staphylococcus petrasii TaxID=1276936 RepID=A0A380G0W6_9STAP|nr:hypothetical protein [Staphylococcus petrasii]PNZ31288.1 hypothetical protein CD137_03250 [Staphylococcus petrasii]TGE11720.1 hypothetical protein E2557_08375 [Staphylococcus petrasii]TGE15108.1 hypothetical protein BJR09_12095 [Staphylococcus petrasii]SUM44625.1 Uncharacterised protein [Staphylococcus petrasii]